MNAEILFAHYQDRLRRYLGRASGETELARDLTQEVFLRVSRAAIPVAAETQLAGWLFRIARNVALDHYRQRKRQPEEALGTLDMARSAPQETTTALNQALSTLPDVDRDVFLLREMSGLSYDEIASACELTPDAVRNRIHRARLQLRDVLSASLRPLRTRQIRPIGRPTRVRP